MMGSELRSKPTFWKRVCNFVWRVKLGLGPNQDAIAAVGIDPDGRLFVKPAMRSFPLIWRSAAEVHWDPDRLHLYSPCPREWSYVDWFMHIVSVVYTDYGVRLRLSDQSVWVAVSDQLKMEIILAEDRVDQFYKS